MIWPARCWADSGSIPAEGQPSPECQAMAWAGSVLELCERHDRELLGRDAPVRTGALR